MGLRQERKKGHRIQSEKQKTHDDVRVKKNVDSTCQGEKNAPETQLEKNLNFPPNACHTRTSAPLLFLRDLRSSRLLQTSSTRIVSLQSEFISYSLLLTNYVTCESEGCPHSLSVHMRPRPYFTSVTNKTLNSPSSSHAMPRSSSRHCQCRKSMSGTVANEKDEL